MESLLSPDALSVVLCTLNRPEELDACVTSLMQAGVQIIHYITERGALARLRNQGLFRVTTPLVAYLDDDCVVSPAWLTGLLGVYRQRPEVVGVSGSAVIPPAFRRNRDLFRFWAVRPFYDWCFIRPEHRPGHLTKAGTFVPEPDYTYHGPVEFLEACNQTYRTEALKAIGGFDEAYGGIGDWSEPDVAFRLRCRYGNASLWFDPQVVVEHRCSPRGAMVFRRTDARQRLANYHLFSKRWVTPSWRQWCYQRFLEGYYLGWHSWCGLRR